MRHFILLLVGLALLAFGFSVGFLVGGLRAERNAYHNRFMEERAIIGPILANDPGFAGISIDEEYTGHAHLSGAIDAADYGRLQNALSQAVGYTRARDMVNSLEKRNKPPPR